MLKFQIILSSILRDPMNNYFLANTLEKIWQYSDLKIHKQLFIVIIIIIVIIIKIIINITIIIIIIVIIVILLLLFLP